MKTPMAPVSLPATTRSAPQAAPLPFAYLGKLTENGESVIVLHGGGRMLKVRGPGPLTEDYEVDAVLENLLVLRYLPSGAQQTLELSSRQPPAIPYSSPAESEQD